MSTSLFIETDIRKQHFVHCVLGTVHPAAVEWVTLCDQAGMAKTSKPELSTQPQTEFCAAYRKHRGVSVQTIQQKLPENRMLM